jgi:competence protein ComEC
VGRRKIALFLGSASICIILAGFTVAQFRTAFIEDPMLERVIGSTTLTGQFSSVELFPVGSSLTLEKLRIAKLDPSETPNRIRIRVRSSKGPVLAPGDWIRLRARIAPPSQPAMPGAFDFQRKAFFKGLGEVGFSYGAPEVLARGNEAATLSRSQKIMALRQFLGERISMALPDDTAGVARVLMLGDRKGISETIMEAIRASGLAHLLAISGLYIGLVAGVLFLEIRATISLIPRISLYHPVKKWAAAFALLGALGYAAMTGGSVPTVRALLMFSLVLLAVMVDRRGLSIRLVAWAALIVLIFRSEILLGASFQLSFAAVTALIARHEKITRRKRLSEGERPWW